MGGKISSNNPIEKFITECNMKKFFNLTLDEVKVTISLI
jgi:hypothetical protein